MRDARLGFSAGMKRMPWPSHRASTAVSTLECRHEQRQACSEARATPDDRSAGSIRRLHDTNRTFHQVKTKLRALSAERRAEPALYARAYADEPAPTGTVSRAYCASCDYPVDEAGCAFCDTDDPDHALYQRWGQWHGERFYVDLDYETDVRRRRDRRLRQAALAGLQLLTTNSATYDESSGSCDRQLLVRRAGGP